MLAKAIAEAKSDDAKAIAARLEGMTVETLAGGEASMRADDHQLFRTCTSLASGQARPRLEIRRGEYRLGMQRR